MIVGVYLGEIYEKEGGGFTFQENIVKEILRTPTRHKFIFFYSGTDIFNNENLAHHVKIRIPTYFRLGSFFFRRFHGIRHRVIRTMKKKYPKQNVYTFFDWWVKRYEIGILYITGYKNVDTELPYIYTIWDLQHRLQPFFPEVSMRKQWKNREEMFMRMTQRAAYVLTGTLTGKKELQQFYGIAEDRIRLLLHPTPQFALKSSRNTISLNLKLPAEYILYPAQFWPHKNHIIILKALKRLNENQGKLVNAVFVGHDYGNKDYIIEKAKEFGIENQVFIFDFLKRDELIALYQHAKALVYVSHFGPENLPPLEAMALGCPVIYGKVNGAQEQLGDCALLVNQLSVEELSEAISCILSNNQVREELVQKGYKRANAYTNENYVKDLLGIIDEFEPLRECWP